MMRAALRQPPARPTWRSPAPRRTDAGHILPMEDDDCGDRWTRALGLGVVACTMLAFAMPPLVRLIASMIGGNNG